MGDKFILSQGQGHELEMAFGRNGWTNADVKKLCGGDLLAQILRVVREERGHDTIRECDPQAGANGIGQGDNDVWLKDLL